MRPMLLTFCSKLDNLITPGPNPITQNCEQQLSNEGNILSTGDDSGEVLQLACKTVEAKKVEKRTR